MRIAEAKKRLVACINAGLPVLLQSAPGVGKSDLTYQAATACDADYMLMHPVVSDPTDAKGLPCIVDGEAEFKPYGDMRRLMTSTKRLVCVLDDLGQAPAVVQAAFMQLILSRRINGHKISDHVVFVACTNRRQDKAGVAGILEPVKSRFACILELTAHIDDWTQWAIAAGVDARIIAFLRLRPALLHDFKPTADIVNSPCPRTWTNAARLVSLGFTDVETLAGAIGQGAATELASFLPVMARMPNPETILLNPDTADVPSHPAVAYAVCGALAARCTTKTAARIMTYIRRLPQEFGQLLKSDCERMLPDGLFAAHAGTAYVQFEIETKGATL